MFAPGFVLALAGPFGSFAAPLGQRLAYWIPTMASGSILGWVFASGLLRAAPRLADRRMLFTLVHATALTAAMVLIVSGWGAVIFTAEGAPRITPLLVFYVGLVTFAISGLRIARLDANTAGRRAAPQGASTPTMTAPVAPQAPALARRLRQDQRTSAILALEAEDHYVRVHTSTGTDLLLMRLSDAIEEMASVPGLRIHRSWWVSADGVARMRRENGKTIVVLASGAEAPVSRGAAAEAQRVFSGKT